MIYIYIYIYIYICAHVCIDVCRHTHRYAYIYQGARTVCGLIRLGTRRLISMRIRPARVRGADPREPGVFVFARVVGGEHVQALSLPALCGGTQRVSL